jgi:hypothetical protein
MSGSWNCIDGDTRSGPLARKSASYVKPYAVGFGLVSFRSANGLRDVACPASAGYRARKYIRRHRVAVGVTGIAAVLLIAFAVAQTIELRRTRRERDRADRVTEFMTGMFKVSDPSDAQGNDIRAREILDKASQQIDTGLAKDPQLQAQIMAVMGDVYQSLGLYAKAESLLSRAVEVRKRTLGAKNTATLK